MNVNRMNQTVPACWRKIDKADGGLTQAEILMTFSLFVKHSRRIYAFSRHKEICGLEETKYSIMINAEIKRGDDS